MRSSAIARPTAEQFVADDWRAIYIPLMVARKAKPRAEVEWRAGLLKNRFVKLGPVWAPNDADAALREAAKRYNVTSPQERRRLSVQRVR
jgi:hypothetical protein